MRPCVLLCRDFLSRTGLTPLPSPSPFAVQSEGTVTLAGTVGLPFDHPISPRQAVLDLSAASTSAESSGQWALNPALQRAFHTDAPVHLSDFVVELPEDLRQRACPATAVPL